MKRLVVALALVALAFPAASTAAPALPQHQPALGTDVAAPDQQSPIAPAPPAADGGGFDWSDAGVGAGGAIVVLAGSLAAALTLRRRRTLAG